MAAETGLEEAMVAFNQEVRAPTVYSAHLGAGKGCCCGGQDAGGEPQRTAPRVSYSKINLISERQTADILKDWSVEALYQNAPRAPGRNTDSQAPC